MNPKVLEKMKLPMNGHLDRNDGNLVGRLATDGKASLSQPVAAGNAAIWQSAGGNLVSASAK